jgi:DNA-binding MarR family transcriptional regulator
MIIVPKKEIPEDILKDSVLAHIAEAYFSVGKQLEQKTQCSPTRGFILSTLRGGVTLNQNQIATLLGLDRTVVHRSIKTMVREGLVSEKKAKTGKAIQVSLTPKGTRYRKRLIQARKAADAAVRKELIQKDRAILVQLLKRIAELKL